MVARSARTYVGRRLHRRVELVLGVHRLDPCHVGAPAAKPLGLLGEGVDRFGAGPVAERLQDVTGRSHGAGDDDRAPRFVRDATCDTGTRFVDFHHTVAEAVQREPVPIGAEGVGENDVGARVDHAPVDRGDLPRIVEVPALAAGAAVQPEGEQVRAHGAVREEPFASRQECSQWMHRCHREVPNRWSTARRRHEVGCRRHRCAPRASEARAGPGHCVPKPSGGDRELPLDDAADRLTSQRPGHRGQDSSVGGKLRRSGGIRVESAPSLAAVIVTEPDAHHHHRRRRSCRRPDRDQPAPGRVRRAHHRVRRRAGAAVSAPAAVEEVPVRGARAGTRVPASRSLLREERHRASARKRGAGDRSTTTHGGARRRRHAPVSRIS